MASRRPAFIVAAAVLAWSCAHAPADNAEPAPPVVVDQPSVDAGPSTHAGDAAVDASSAGCSDHVKNGSESDVDCGGDACPKCAAGRACTAATDCQASACSIGKCGTRAWSVESTGSNVPIAGVQVWTPAPGLSVTATLAEASLLYMRWTGTSRWVGGGNAICHLGQRFVVDGKPTGDTIWGNAIMVQNATRAHEGFADEIAMALPAGPHTVTVEMTNATGYATCNLDGDSGLPYDRSQLLVSAHDPNLTWYAESTGETGALAPGPWTDIPGVFKVFSLSANQHVQLSVNGTQLSEGTGSAHCAYRFVIDGAPQGHPTHGQTITVGDVAGGWWSPVELKYGTDLGAGAHSIGVQVANTSAAGGTCNAGQGNNAYARFRMLLAATPAGGIARSVESSGGAYVLAAGSAWTAIGGLTTTFTLPTAGDVQLELAATQRTLTGVGQCAWRYVIDGVAAGDANYGQAINMGDGAKTWWTETSLQWGRSLPAGGHIVNVEARNASGGDCGTSADALPYGRARLLVRAP